MSDTSQVHLFGRANAQAALDAAIGKAIAGRSSTLTVVGNAGLGKTALLEWTEQRAAHQACRVLWCSGYETDVHLTFAGLVALLRPIGHLLDHVDRHHAATLRIALALHDDGATVRSEVAAATLGILAACADQTPTVCLIDDLHWLDRGSVDAISFAARRLRDDRIAFVFASREQSLVHPPGSMLRLAALDREESLALVRSRRPKIDGRTANQIVRAAAGVPLDLTWLTSGIDSHPSRPATITFGSVAAQLGEQSLFAAVVIALEASGTAAIVHDALAAAAIEIGALDECEHLGLINRADATIGVVHPLAREAILEVSRGDMQRRAHRVLARVYATHGHTDRVLWHLVAASVGPDDELAAELVAVAEDSLRRGDPASASRAFEIAAELSTAIDARCRLLTSAGATAAQSGANEVALLDRAQTHATSPSQMDQILVMRCLAATWRGDWWVAPHAVRQHGAEMANRSPEAAGVIYACATGAAFQQLDLELMQECAQSNPWHDRDIDAIPGPASLIAVNTGFVAAVLSDPDQAGKVLTRCAHALNNSIFIDAATPCAFALLWIEQHKEAEDLLQSSLNTARDQGNLAATGWLLTAAAQLAINTGEVLVATSACHEALELLEGGENKFALETCQTQIGWLAAVRGDQAEATLSCRRRFSSAHAATAGAHALGLLMLGQRDFEGALGELLRAWEPIRHSRDLNPIVFRLSADLAEAALCCGARDVEREVVCDLELALAKYPSRWLSLVASRVSVLRCRRVDLDESITRAETAAAAHPSCFERGRTELVVGERLRRAKQRGRARPHLERAVTIFNSIGARPWLDRAAAELLAAGGSLPMPLDEGSGLERMLTPQEWRVAVAVATGSTNAQIARDLFLSVKTIEGHLSRIYRKTGLTSRTELVRAYMQLTLPAAIILSASTPSGTVEGNRTST